MNFTTAAIAEQRRNDMISAAAHRSTVRTARAAQADQATRVAGRNGKPAGRLQSLLAALFGTTNPTPASAPTPTTAAVESAPVPASTTDLRSAA